MAGADDREFVLGLVPDLFAIGAPAWREKGQMTANEAQVVGDALAGLSGSASVLIAEDAGGQRLGFIYLCEEEDHYGGVCGHVGDIVVAGDARGRGVGRAMMAAGERWAQARGYRLLTLNVFVENVKARALYDELGYRPETIRHVKVLGDDTARSN